MWDALAPEYDAWYETPLGAFVLRVEVVSLVGLAGEVTEKCALEVGCGTGRFGRAFAERGACVTGVDLSGAMLAEAGKDRKEGLNLCRDDAGRLPLPASSFDLAFAATLLEFVRHPSAVLTEMWRVLRPGG